MRPTQIVRIAKGLLSASLMAAMTAVVMPPAARAQAPQSAPGGPAAAAPASPQSGPSSRMEARVDQRITQLHSELHITAAQAPQWDNFAQTMRDNARRMDEAFVQRAQQFRTMNAVQNMESYATMAAEHADDVKRLVASFTPLYDALSPQQKQTADEVFRNSGATRRR